MFNDYLLLYEKNSNTKGQTREASALFLEFQASVILFFSPFLLSNTISPVHIWGSSTLICLKKKNTH